MPRKRPPGSCVYVSLRVYDPARKVMRHVRGRTVIFEKFTPDQVYKLILEAGRAAHEAGKRRKDGKEEPAESIDPNRGHPSGEPQQP